MYCQPIFAYHGHLNLVFNYVGKQVESANSPPKKLLCKESATFASFSKGGFSKNNGFFRVVCINVDGKFH